MLSLVLGVSCWRAGLRREGEEDLEECRLPSLLEDLLADEGDVEAPEELEEDLDLQPAEEEEDPAELLEVSEVLRPFMDVLSD